MKKKLIIISATALAIVGILSVAHANSSFTYPSVATATATSSVTSLAQGASTSLITDSYSTGIPRLNATAVVLLQEVASSSASVLDVSVSYSQDGIDYFADSVNISTTTVPVRLTDPNFYRLTGNTVSSTTRSAFVISLPTRYAKVTFTATTGISSIYAIIVPQREAVQ